MRVDPLAFAVLLPTLWAAHNVGDHLVQTDYEAAHKATDWTAMAGHVGGYQITQSLATMAVRGATGLRCSRWAMLAGGLFSAVSHAFLDRRWPVRGLMEATGSPGYAAMELETTSGAVFAPGRYQADQACHHACLLVTALIMAARRG